MSARLVVFAVLALWCLAPAAPADGPTQQVAVEAETPPVGRPARLADLVLPGSELEVLPANSLSPLVLRIAAVRPHGDRFRYDLEYWGREAGSFDLRDYLRRVDGSDLRAGEHALAPLPVQVTSVLPPGQVLPRPPRAGELPGLGGYRLWIAVTGGLWVAGLVAWFWLGRRRALQERDERAPTTLADVLRPLVRRAMAGDLAPMERARLELGLLALWRRRLGLEGERPEQVLGLLRRHPEAGPLLGALESWLHRPPTEAGAVDLEVLLAPYRELTAGEWRGGEVVR